MGPPPNGDGGGGGGDNNDASCSGCDFISPCVEQGLCLDPTVLHLPPSSPEGGAGGGGQSSQHRQAFLIEGQLVVASSDGTWQPTTLPTATTAAATITSTTSITSVTSTLPAADADAVDSTTPATTTAPATPTAASAAAAVFTGGTPHALTGAEVASLGLPASPEEARAYLVRTHADTVPHGDHVDFVVGDRLIHIVTAGDNVNGDCGSDCGNHHEGGAGRAGGAGAGVGGGGARGGGGGGGTVLGHARAPAVVDHGRLHIARSRLGAAAEEQSAASITSSAAAAGGNGNGNGNGNGHGKPPSSVPRAAIGGGRYMPLVKKQDASSTAAAADGGDVTADVTSVEAVHLALTVEHAGGGEASTHTRLKVHGICCPSEVPLIHSILDHRPGVRSVKVIVPTKTVLVEHAATAAPAASIVDALNAARLQASLASANAAPGGGGGGGGGGDASELNRCCGAGALPPPTILIACVLLAVSLFHYVGGPLEHLKWIALGAVAAGDVSGPISTHAPLTAAFTRFSFSFSFHLSRTACVNEEHDFLKPKSEMKPRGTALLQPRVKKPRV